MQPDPRHGMVHELLGIARDAGEWSFSAARIKLAGNSLNTGPRLKPVLAARLPAVLHLLPEPRTDAIWARARIEALFGVASPPEDQRGEKSLMELGFVARRAQVVIPFVCSDHYGKSALYFAEAVPAADVDAIGDAFWGLVASGGKVVDYRDRAYHIGAGVWMEYGCTNGTLFLEYPPDDDDEEPPGDPEEAALASAMRFLETIGDERPGTTCREPDCNRGTVQASVFCRRHHFAAVMGRPFPPDLA